VHFLPYPSIPFVFLIKILLAAVGGSPPGENPSIPQSCLFRFDTCQTFSLRDDTFFMLCSHFPFCTCSILFVHFNSLCVGAEFSRLRHHNARCPEVHQTAASHCDLERMRQFTPLSSGPPSIGCPLSGPSIPW